jgi:hypothetical protein
VKSGRSTAPNEFMNKAVYHYVVALRRSLGTESMPKGTGQLLVQQLRY